jgi:scyllo-inositol 2-dehydrogenase (NADP+)
LSAIIPRSVRSHIEGEFTNLKNVIESGRIVFMRVSQSLRLGFCGFGAAAEYFHLPLIQANDSFSCIAVVDPSSDRRQRAYELGFTQTGLPDDLSEMIRDLRLDIVVIASPNRCHYSQSLASLRAGAHILIEKPAAETVQHFDEIWELARSKRLTVVPFQNRRFDHDHVHAFSAFKDGRLGKLVRIDMSIAQWGPFNQFAVRAFNPDWRTEKRYGGGCLNDWGPHLLDRLLHFSNGLMPSKIHAVARSGKWSSDVDDLLVAIYEWDSWFARIMISTVDASPLERVRICGTQATLTVLGDDLKGEIVVNGSTETRRSPYENSVFNASVLYDLMSRGVQGESGEVNDLVRSARRVLALLEKTRRSIDSQHLMNPFPS